MKHHLVQQQRAVVVLLRLVDVPGDERWKSAVGSVRIRWEEATDDDAVGGDKRLRGTRDRRPEPSDSISLYVLGLEDG